MPGPAPCGEDLQSKDKDSRDVRAKWINYAIDRFLWATGCALVLWIVVSKEYSLIFSFLKYAIIVFLFSEGFSAISRTVLGEQSPKTILSRIHFSIALTLSFATSTLLSGDWSGGQVLPSLEFGSFYAHHADWSGLVSAMFFPVTAIAFLLKNEKAKTNFYRSYSIIPIIAGVVIAILFVTAMFEENFSSSTLSFRLVSGILTFVLLGFGALLRSSATKARGFKRIMASLFGIALGIFFHGVVGLIEGYPDGAKNF